MQHVFVETNWVVAYAAPAHHKDENAVELLARARAGELMLHIPALCLVEARHPIWKLQPRHEADAIRNFLPWARAQAKIDEAEEHAVRRVLNMFESRIGQELRRLHEIITELRNIPHVEVFPLNDRMLCLATALIDLRLGLKPFDLSILAAVLGRASELREAGERSLAFCELDADLQPWDRLLQPREPLHSLYEERRLWVYEDFTLESPSPPAAWPAG